MYEPINKIEVPEKLKREFDWFKVIFMLHLYVLTILGLYFIPQANISTWLFGIVLIVLGFIGVTAGAHRLWAHRSYTASSNLRVFLMLCQTLVGQGSIYNWVLQHRIHHKYFGTTFDPFNSNKGFLFSHILHFIHKPHEYQDQLESEIDMKDIEEDKVVMFQKKYYWLLYFVLFALLPMNAPAEYWGENLVVSCVIIGWLRYFIVINLAWLVHSGIKIWGLEAGEKYPCDTNLVFFVDKSYWIQYHYLAPWDYLTGEYGKYGTDFTSKFIRVCAAVGAATDLKTINSDAVKAATYKSVKTNTPIYDCLLEEEKVCLEKQYYLEPLKVMI